MNLPQNPVFIVGYPRSGTTLVQRLLAAQPGFRTVPETHYFNVIERKVGWEGGDNESIPSEFLAAIYDKIHEKMNFRFSDPERAELERRAEKRELTSKTLFESIIGRFLSNRAPDIEAGSSFRWIEKTPNHAHFLDRIVRLYPRMQAIHVLRHPVAAIFSRKLKFPFNRDVPVSELARRWNRMIKDVEQFKNAFPGLLLTVRYEDLFTGLDRELEALGKFLSLSFDAKAVEAVLEGTENPAEGFILASEPWKLEDRRRVWGNTNDAYRNVFSGDDVEAIESVVGENMEKCGYGPYGKN